MTLLEVNKSKLDSLVSFLNQIPNTDYCKPLTVFNGSSVGEHTRHIVEFYQCLITQSADGVVCYDLRERNQLLQREAAAASAALQRVIVEIEKLDLEQQLVLEVNPHEEESDNQQIETNLHRELHYVLDHTIHHMALITVGVRSAFPNITLPADFGVAPSTIRSRSAAQG